MFYLESAVETAIHLFHLMNKAGIVPFPQQDQERTLSMERINRKTVSRGSCKGSQGGSIYHLCSLKFVFLSNQSLQCF